MARHRRRGRRNPSLRGVFSAGKSAFSKHNLRTAAGLIGGVALTTVLTDLALSPSFMYPIKRSKIGEVVSTLFMSGISGMLARMVPLGAIKGQAGNIAMGGVVAGVTKALRYLTAGTSFSRFLNDYDEGMSAYADPRMIMNAVGTSGFMGNYADPRQIANAYHMQGINDYESFPQVQSAVRLDGLSNASRISEDDVTSAAMQGMM